MPARRRLILVGGGHAHVVVLKSLGMTPEPGLDVTLIAKELDAPYSGMLPGHVAGHYDLDACHIDLVRLAHFAGARLVHGEADGIDSQRRDLHIAGRPPLRYDLLSIDTGITPALDSIRGATEHAIPVKPVSSFAPRWRALEARAFSIGGPRRITVVGTGAAGFELVLAIRHRLLEAAPSAGIDGRSFQFTLIGSGRVLPTHNARAQRLGEQALAEAGVAVITGDAAIAVTERAVVLASGREVASDATLITTKAQPPDWFAGTGLAIDDRGFLSVRPTLQVVGEDDIFAVGDCASVIGYPREKAGVFAVRQGPPLAENIRLRARGMAAKPFRPQSQFLTLLSCGGRQAIAARGPFAMAGAWAWTLKDRIDRGFMRRFQDLPSPMVAGAENADAMHCAGCAAKVGPVPLSRALDRIEALAPEAIAGRGASLLRRDDVAVLDLGPGPLRLETIDHFPAIWPEPYLLGEIVAAHAISDVLAKGGRPDHALALVGLPPGAPHLVEDDLVQLLAGVTAVLRAHDVGLVGGHTGRGEALAAGLFVSGSVERGHVVAKGGLVQGDVLVLTKPLGSGIVFAGWMRRLARAREVSAALAAMRASNAAAARVLLASDVRAMTDVTGFGLAGHLIEMLDASDGPLEAVLGLAQIPRYPGVDRLIAAGVRSSLLPDNAALSPRVDVAGPDAEATLALVFDPQTSGGLLASVPNDRAAQTLVALKAAGIDAVAIGHVEAASAPALETSRSRLRIGDAIRAPQGSATRLITAE